MVVGLLVDRYPEAIELARVKAWRRLLLPPRRPEGDDGDQGSWESFQRGRGTTTRVTRDLQVRVIRIYIKQTLHNEYDSLLCLPRRLGSALALIRVARVFVIEP